MRKEDLLEAARLCDEATPDEEGVRGIDYLEACATEAVEQFPVLAAPCRDCAFTPGTEAHNHRITGPSAAHCVERSHAFWCHKARDARGDVTHICGGWAEAIIERARALT